MSDQDQDTQNTAEMQAAHLTMGNQVQVLVPEGTVLLDRHTGAKLPCNVPTWQTVDATLLRRLSDGDLILSPAAAPA